MRTEQHLRAVLAAREHLAPEPDPVLAGARRLAARRRRHRTAGAAAAAALTVVAGVTVPVAVHQAGPGPAGSVLPAAAPSDAPASPAPPPDLSQPRPPYAFTLLAGAAAGFEIQPVALSAEYQLAEIRWRGDPPARLGLVVYQPGSTTRVRGEVPGWDVTPDPRPARVNGAPGWYSTDGYAGALRWEYTPGGWAVVGSASDPPLGERTLRRLAESVRFGEPYQVRLPYRLDYLPADLRPFHVLLDTYRPGAFRSVARLESVDEDAPRVVDITIAEDPEANGPDRHLQRSWDWRSTTIAGRPAQCADLVDGRRCRIEFDGLTVSIGSGGLAGDELVRIVAGLRFASWSDPATWYDLDTALPGQ
jgi:hypothetical protein